MHDVKLVYPERDMEEEGDIYIENGIIKKIGKDISTNGDIDIIDGRDKVVVPSLTDMHVHLREPGFEWKETIETGSMAAVAGGFTSIACMPNTEPPIDDKSMIEFIYEKADKAGLIRIYPIGTITKKREGKEISEMGDMFLAGAKAFSDDGACVQNSEVLRCALEYSKMFGVSIIEHAEDSNLSQEGSINWGKTATLLGLKGIPWVAETSMVARDIFLSSLTDGNLHIAHVSCWQSLEMIKWAKEKGINVTCEVTPHHLVLTEEDMKKSNYDTNTKVNPPLRTKEDQEALWDGIKNDLIDVIATDHAPHHLDDKMVEYNLAEFGISGLETAVPLIITYGYFQNKISLVKLFKKMSYNPAKILNIPYIPLEENVPANFTLIDLSLEKTVDKEKFFSKGKNTPFHGWTLKGWPIMTFVEGRIVFKEGKIMR
ncbi:MAG TPA: dihydroorotase [Dictyoglomaceae bacterium]|nr:dihydroorotase [Dictyoglomaceae bacterium]